MKDKNDSVTRELPLEVPPSKEAALAWAQSYAIEATKGADALRAVFSPKEVTEVWYVVGEVKGEEWPTLFRTKAAAEAYCKELFPDNSPERRYARVMYRKVE